ncbi:hypothetical protein EDB87DRAFT_1582902 [Lactarius vividus]|nr:hypothetical protein EDB87DRAFT_1582902 [Lactarius vividus]
MTASCVHMIVISGLLSSLVPLQSKPRTAHSIKMQSTNTGRPNSDAVSGESAPSVRRPCLLETPSSLKTSQNVDGPFGNDPLIHWHIRTGAGVANNQSGAPSNEIDSAEAAMAKEMGRFVQRGPPSIPARGPPSHFAQPTHGTPNTPAPAFHTTASTTENRRKPTPTAIVKTTSQQKNMAVRERKGRTM